MTAKICSAGILPALVCRQDVCVTALPRKRCRAGSRPADFLERQNPCFHRDVAMSAKRNAWLQELSSNLVGRLVALPTKRDRVLATFACCGGAVLK
ncbi:MAG: hypothetical protein ONB48_00075 [candidate division KSB1 bacterium]|nr:hypothetical protein [candidate division KSB1 bacterium]MDZ7272930.1 hypothetical protein [candidate division KSB1 bacterium]MDZ7284048.1 hypothetical protein [candidate division KSB1 bacterium]MDZ7297555.1 hypothetical protein [candidate division KSB1 bacterium]MDZ7308923.1 hypothetical protein [candidate division KSB1 bacterium]